MQVLVLQFLRCFHPDPSHVLIGQFSAPFCNTAVLPDTAEQSLPPSHTPLPYDGKSRPTRTTNHVGTRTFRPSGRYALYGPLDPRKMACLMSWTTRPFPEGALSSPSMLASSCRRFSPASNKSIANHPNNPRHTRKAIIPIKVSRNSKPTRASSCWQAGP